MRISDWSSDVCSSDLSLHIRARQFGRSRIARGQQREIQRGRLVADAILDRLHRRERSEHRIAPRVGLAVEHELARSVEQADRGVRQFDLKQRSEEHTSELQSLMRISYAVFCLKKKNTT